MNIKQSLSILLVLLFSAACTDVIDVELQESEPQLVVDAWINNKAEIQVIKLRQTSPYFDTAPSPAVTGASVEVSDESGNVFGFVDPDEDGNYTMDPRAGATFANIGQTYTLRILLDGDEYTATSVLNPVAPVDSITYEYREEELGAPEGIYAEFFGRDLSGLGNCYWIKSFKNGQFLNKPAEINIAYDAGFSAGSEVDGLIFIPPIREAINRVPDDGDDAVDNSDVAPWAPGDSVYVEIHSLTVDAFDYLDQARTQMTLGDAGIFAEPLSNVPTNVSKVNSSDGLSAVGFFNVSAVSSLGIRIE